MLANPVVVPAHADPAIWCIAVLAIAAETRTVRTMFGRRGEDVRGLDGPIALFNLATWTLFLWAVDAIDLHTHLPVTWAIAVLEVR